MNSQEERMVIVKRIEQQSKDNKNILALLVSGSESTKKTSKTSDLDIRIIEKKPNGKNGYTNKKKFEGSVPVHTITLSKKYLLDGIKNNDMETIEIMRYSKLVFERDNQVKKAKELAEKYVVPKHILEKYLDNAKSMYVKAISRKETGELEASQYILTTSLEIIANAYLLSKGVIDPKTQWAIQEIKNNDNNGLFYKTFLKTAGIDGDEKKLNNLLGNYGLLLIELQKDIESAKK